MPTDLRPQAIFIQRSMFNHHQLNLTVDKSSSFNCSPIIKLFCSESVIILTQIIFIKNVNYFPKRLMQTFIRLGSLRRDGTSDLDGGDRVVVPNLCTNLERGSDDFAVRDLGTFKQLLVSRSCRSYGTFYSATLTSALADELGKRCHRYFLK